MLAAHTASFLRLIYTALEDISRGVASKNADCLRAAHEELARFRSAVEHSQPNSRVRMLGLA
jgi:hypothetical protein